MADCRYQNTLKIGFGRTVTWAAINEQFDAIEDAFGCLQDLVDTLEYTKTTTYIDIVENVYEIDPGLGAIFYLTLNGDVSLTMKTPEEGDPKLIILVLEDGKDTDGSASRFNFTSGTTWTTDSEGSTVDGKPWDTMGLAGDYGAMVTCIWDGIGWVHLCYSRNDIDITATPEVADVYNWR